MKALICQTNTTPGDFKGNVEQITKGIGMCRDQDINVIIFPELSIPGYLCKDLMYEKDFVQKNLDNLHYIASLSINVDPYIVVGYIDANRSGKGKPFRNMLAVIRHGVIVGTYQKRLLPFYDVFDEGRYFEPGTDMLVLNIDGEKVGFAICEDFFFNCKGETDLYNYDTNPITLYKKLGVNTIVSINSSPYTKEKPEFRLKMLQGISRDNRVNLIYVNQVGGQDDLMFDGHSCVIGGIDDAYGAVIHLLKSEVCYELVSTKDGCLGLYEDIVENKNQNIYNMLVMGIRDYVTKNGIQSVVLGSSGGIDSALVATLACDAIGREKVNCIMMPSCWSSEGSVNDAKLLHTNLGCNEILCPIQDHLEHIKYLQGHMKFGEKYNLVADENIQSRTRGITIMYYANALGALSLGTSNKCESAVGYFTVFGDTANFFNPLIDLYKMEIYGLAKWINQKKGKEIIPNAIIDKAPSAELAPGQEDEKALLPYTILDKVVELYIEEYVNTHEDFCRISRMSVSKEDYNRIVRLIRMNEFKRRMVAIGIKLSKKSFGSGRRYPIVAKY